MTAPQIEKDSGKGWGLVHPVMSTRLALITVTLMAFRMQI